MTSLADTFLAARAENRAALIGYLPAGFPSYDGAIAAITAMVESGVDIVEIGLPYSDPVMEGPVITEAVTAALAAGSRTSHVLTTVTAVAALGVPTLVMGYWNIVERYGVDRFADDLAAAGGVGAILPDITPEEAGPWLDACSRDKLDPVFLVAPASTDERIALAAKVCGGFVYAASVMGVTGVRSSVGEHAHELVERVRPHTELPVCVGLGVSTGEQAAQVAAYADGVIVGSAFVRRLFAAPTLEAGVAAVAELTKELAAGVRSR